MDPVSAFPEVTQRIEQDVRSVSGKRTCDFHLIRAKRGISVYRCLYDGIPAVAKHFEKERDRREILNYRILIRSGIPTIKVLAFGESTLVLEDVDQSEEWRLGIAEDLADMDVAKGLARWYFAFHEKGSEIAERGALYFEYDAITKQKLEMLKEKLPDAAALFDFLIMQLDKLRDLFSKPEFTLAYNDFYWTNFAVRKDKQEVMMFDYNLLGKGYRYSDFRNVRSLSEAAYNAFVSEYGRLYYQKHGKDRKKDEDMEMRIDEVAAPLLSLIFAFEQERFPAWAESAKIEALNGVLISKARGLLL